MLEKNIQTNIIKKLEEAGWIVLKSISNNKSGFPDIQALKSGMIMFIEVKRPGVQPTPIQRFRHDQLRAHGFAVQVCHSDEDLFIPHKI